MTFLTAARNNTMLALDTIREHKLRTFLTMLGVIIGNLDGVHRGHQAVLRQARAIADARGLSTVVLTFDPHPSQVLRGSAPPRLSTLERRIAQLDVPETRRRTKRRSADGRE